MTVCSVKSFFHTIFLFDILSQSLYNFPFFVDTKKESIKEDNHMKWFDNIALTLVIIGALNWLLVGVFRFDLVAYLFGNLSGLSRIIYTDQFVWTDPWFF